MALALWHTIMPIKAVTDSDGSAQRLPNTR
jgi:hypothetical protein